MGGGWGGNKRGDGGGEYLERALFDDAACDSFAR